MLHLYLDSNALCNYSTNGKVALKSWGEEKKYYEYPGIKLFVIRRMQSEKTFNWYIWFSNDR